jgi:cysteine-S-conjugate beta-lyase
MRYDFDTEIPRDNTSSVKWGIMIDENDPVGFRATDMYQGENRVLPMWVADMDFRCAQPIIDALTARAQHGIFGYSFPSDSYRDAVVGWMAKRHDWHIDPSWIVTTPGVVSGITTLIRAFVKPGEKVLIQNPVYSPFKGAAEANGAIAINNPLIFRDGRYWMDFDDLEAKARDPEVKMAILCNPHNPIGQVWSPEDLTRFAEICIANDVLMVSDEIHGDLILSGVNFRPLASLRDDFVPHVITCTAPSKTFNLAGLQVSNIIIADADLRKRFTDAVRGTGLFVPNAFAVVAVEAAYRYGDEWLDQVLAYIEGNARFLEQYMAENIPQIKVAPLEGTYLAWLDCRALELDREELSHLMMDEARVFLEGGTDFGEEGDGFQRINIACPRSILVEALERIRVAVANRQAVR